MALTAESYQEMQLLLRSVQPEIFRLIFVQHNHRQVVGEVLKQLRTNYPKRAINLLQVTDQDYRGLTTAIYQQNGGILALENFQEILKKPDISVGFNQRRDKIAEYPLALLCFIPTGGEVLSDLMKKLPDLWSFRNLVVELMQELTEDIMVTVPASPEPAFSSLGGKTIQRKEKELNRLIRRVEKLQTESDSAALINTYYPQILQLSVETGAYQRGLEYAEQFLKIAEKNRDDYNLPALYSTALAWKSRFLQYLGRFNDAKGLLEEALSLDVADFGEEHPWTVGKLIDMAQVYEKLGAYDVAKDLYERSLAASVKIYGDNHPDIAAIKSNLGVTYHRLGEYEKARDLLEEVLALTTQYHGENNSIGDISVEKSNLAMVYKDLGEYEKALKLLEEALISDKANYGEKHPKVATRQSNLGVVYQDVGQFKQARDLLEQSLTNYKYTFGEQHPAVATGQSNLATVYESLKEYNRAVDLLTKALAIQTALYGEVHPDVAATQFNLGSVYFKVQNFTKAKELMESAYNNALQSLGEQHPRTKHIKSSWDRLRNLSAPQSDASLAGDSPQ